nr:ubiquitin-like protein 5 isoform X1 [Saimiri boliviensis boliviensis]
MASNELEAGTDLWLSLHTPSPSPHPPKPLVLPRAPTTGVPLPRRAWDAETVPRHRKRTTYDKHGRTRPSVDHTPWPGVGLPTPHFYFRFRFPALTAAGIQRSDGELVASAASRRFEIPETLTLLPPTPALLCSSS